MTGMYSALGVAAVILFLGLMALGLCRSAALADKQAGEHMRKLNIQIDRSAEDKSTGGY